MIRTLASLSILILVPSLALSETSRGLDCGSSPSMKVSKKVENEIQASAGNFLGKIKAADANVFTTYASTVESSLAKNLPDANSETRKLYGCFVTCQLLDKDPSVTTARAIEFMSSKCAGGPEAQEQGGKLCVGRTDWPYGSWHATDPMPGGYARIGMNPDGSVMLHGPSGMYVPASAGPLTAGGTGAIFFRTIRPGAPPSRPLEMSRDGCSFTFDRGMDVGDGQGEFVWDVADPP